MQGVQVAPAINDENSTTGSLLLSAFNGNGSSLQAPGKPGSTLKSTRKAFGNITNTRSDAPPQQPGGTVVKRRFGQDITNSAIKAPNTAATARKPPLATQLKPSSKSSAPEAAPAVTAARVVPVAPWCETEEPERPAGKTWEQLEADRLQEEDEEIERDVQQLMAGLRGPQLFRNMFGIGANSDTDEEDLDIGPRPPTPESIRIAARAEQPCSQIGSSIPILFDYPGKQNFVELLPDIQFTWPDPDMTSEDSHLVAQPAADANQQAPAIQVNPASSSLDDITRALSQQTQQLQIMQYSTCGSPDGVKPAISDTAAQLKSPEALPW